MDPNALTEIAFTRDWLIENIINNEFFWAMIAAGLMVFLRNLPNQIWGRIVRVCTYSLSVHSEDHAIYSALQVWLNHQQFHRWSNRFLLKYSYMRDEDEENTNPGALVRFSDGRRSWVLGPDDGVHFGFYRRTPILIRKETDSDSASHERKEKITVQFLSPFKSRLKNKVLPEINRIVEGDTNKLIIRSMHGHFNLYQARDRTSASTLVFPPGFYKTIIEDMRRFLTSKEEYQRLGIHWHRGYGFFGPPGTGKTSAVLALASELKLAVQRYNLQSCSAGSIISDLQSIGQCLVVLEDADTFRATKPRAQRKSKIKKSPPPDNDQSDAPDESDKETDKITLNDLLSILDGLDTPEGTIFILTSNHPEHFDEALLRPGRVDLQVQFELHRLPGSRCCKVTLRSAQPNCKVSADRPLILMMRYPCCRSNTTSIGQAFGDTDHQRLLKGAWSNGSRFGTLTPAIPVRVRAPLP